MLFLDSFLFWLGANYQFWEPSPEVEDLEDSNEAPFESGQSYDSQGHSYDYSVYASSPCGFEVEGEEGMGFSSAAAGLGVFLKAQASSLDMEFISVSPNFAREGPAIRRDINEFLF